MSRRIMGSASFFELQDHTGRIQIYIRRDDICPEGDPTLYNTVFKKLLDIGDFVGVEGFAFRTNTGELSVHCRSFTVLSKSIRPLPVVKEKDGRTFDAFTDPEVRYRQRYLDLIVNPQVKEVFVKRAQDHGHDARVLQREGLRRGRDADSAAHSGRCVGPSVHHAPQFAGHRPLPAHRHGAVPQEAHRRRIRRRLRVRQELPQRGHGPHAQPRVHLHGDLRGLQGLPLDDGVHRTDARTGGPRRERHDGADDRRPARFRSRPRSAD